MEEGPGLARVLFSALTVATAAGRQEGARFRPAAAPGKEEARVVRTFLFLGGGEY